MEVESETSAVTVVIAILGVLLILVGTIGSFVLASLVASNFDTGGQGELANPEEANDNLRSQAILNAIILPSIFGGIGLTLAAMAFHKGMFGPKNFYDE